MTSAAEYAEYARAHLPPSFADRWIELLRPAVVFPAYATESEHVGLRCGGHPLLPDDVEWPMFEGHVPMVFIAELNCAALAAVGGLDLMPESGHLLFFCVDYGYEAAGRSKDWSNRTTPWTAGRVLYVPDGVPRRPRRTPEGLEALESEERQAQAASTPPSLGSAWAARYFGPEAPALIEQHMKASRYGKKASAPEVYPLWADGFELGIHELRCCVQSGGHSYEIQRPLEIEAARRALRRDGMVDPSENAVLDEAEHWRVLFQDGVDEGDMIGYWLLRDDDLAAGRFDRAYFEMQR